MQCIFLNAKFWAMTGTEVAKLTANDGAAGDYFGDEVSINENYVIVGARWDDDKGAGFWFSIYL